MGMVLERWWLLRYDDGVTRFECIEEGCGSRYA